jgi:hypothetical protein
MGTGQVDAYAFLSAIAESGTDMTFPNVFVALDGQTVISPSIYFENGAAQTYTVSVENSAVASCEVNGNKLIFKGLAEGQTSASVKAASGESFDFIITVRKGANGNGWL